MESEDNVPPVTVAAASGVRELDAELESLVPKAFVDVIVNVYAGFAINVPTTVIDPSKSVFV